MDDAKFALWRASVNEASDPPAQNPGGLLLEETSPLPAPVTNTDDSGETSPTPAPSPGSEEETTSGNLGDDASPGSDGPTVPGGLGVIAGLNFALLFSTVGFSSGFLLWLRWGESQTRRHDDWREHERVTSPNGNLEKSGGKLETKLEMVIEERFQRFEKNLKRMESRLTAKIDKIDDDIRGNGKDGLTVRIVRLESIKNWAIWIIPLTVIPIITAFLGAFFVHYFSNLEKRRKAEFHG